MRVIVDSRGVVQTNPEEATTMAVRGLLTATSMSVTTPIFPKYNNLYVYVNEASGSDTNDGFSLSSPLRTVDKAFEKVNEGYNGDCVVYFASGTYTTTTPLVLPNGQGIHGKPLVLSGTLQTISSNLGILSATSGSTSLTVTPWARSIITLDSTFSAPVVNSLRGAYLIADQNQFRLNTNSGSYSIAENSGSTITITTALGTAAGSLFTSGSTCSIYMPATKILISGTVLSGILVPAGNACQVLGSNNPIFTNNMAFTINENPPGNTSDTYCYWDRVNLIPTRTWIMGTPDNVRNRNTFYQCSIRRNLTTAAIFSMAYYPTLTGAFGFNQTSPTLTMNCGLGATNKTAGVINAASQCPNMDFGQSVFSDNSWNTMASCNSVTFTEVSVYGYGQLAMLYCNRIAATQMYCSNITASSGNSSMFSVTGPSSVAVQNFHVSGFDGATNGVAATATYMTFTNAIVTGLNNLMFNNITTMTNATVRVNGFSVSIGNISASNISSYGMLICSGANALATTAGTGAVISGALGEVYIGSNTTVSTWAQIYSGSITANTDLSASIPQFTTIRR